MDCGMNNSDRIKEIVEGRVSFTVTNRSVQAKADVIQGLQELIHLLEKDSIQGVVIQPLPGNTGVRIEVKY